MGVQLNIKDQATVDLARKLADASGRSITETIRAALEREERARAEEAQKIIAGVMKILEDARPVWAPGERVMTSKEMMDSIYDEDGLPI